MTANSVWKKAQTIELQVSESILPEFDIGFDMYMKISETLKARGFDVEAETAEESAKDIRSKMKE